MDTFISNQQQHNLQTAELSYSWINTSIKQFKQRGCWNVLDYFNWAFIVHYQMNICLLSDLFLIVCAHVINSVWNFVIFL